MFTNLFKKREPKEVKNCCNIGDYVIFNEHIKVQRSFVPPGVYILEPIECKNIKGVVSDVNGDNFKIDDEWYHIGAGIGSVTLISCIKNLNNE